MKNCPALAVQKSYTVFALENGAECHTASDAEYTYKKYGPATNCGGGVGGNFAMDVYMIAPCPPGITILMMGRYIVTMSGKGCNSVVAIAIHYSTIFRLRLLFILLS